MPKLILIGAVVIASSLFGALAVVVPSTEYPTSPVVTVEAVEVANRIGLTPDVLAAAGLSGQQATAVLANITAAATQVAAADAADSASSQAAAALTAALETARSPGATEQSIGEVAAIDAACKSALDARVAAQAALFSAATEGLATETKAKIAALSAGLFRSVPTEFAALTMSREQWTRVVAALRAEARAARTSTELAEPHATLLASIRADPSVITAQNSLGLSLTAVESAFAVATAEPMQP